MLFNSIEFLVFLPVVVVLFYLLPHRLRWIHLLMASIYFYMVFIPMYIVIISVLTIVNFGCGLALGKSSGNRKKWLLTAGIVANVVMLCFFKYYYFFVADLTALLASVHSSFSLPLVLVFPLGLSFVTFQCLSYLFEINRGTIKPEKHFGYFALYSLFFPKLLAGPIERPQHLLPQFREKKKFEKDQFITGLKIILWGFFKKLVIADRLSFFVAEVYNNHETTGTLNLWLAVFVFFPIQLYCDFSGYSSIAVGTAKLMGFQITDNFRRPFLSLTASEFWNRWHISLSSWLRDYVYQPIVISVRNMGKWAVVIGLMATFLVSGFWHGAGWVFIVYGLIQGAIISAEFLLGIKSTKLAKSRGGRVRGMLSTYLFFSFSLIFFRASDITQAWSIVRQMFWQWNFQALSDAVPVLTYVLSISSIIFLFYFEAKHLDNYLYEKEGRRWQFTFSASLITILIAIGVFHNASFIYNRF